MNTPKFGYSALDEGILHIYDDSLHDLAIFSVMYVF